MKMAKKLLAVALAGVLALSVLTGCSGSNSLTLTEALNNLNVKVQYDKKLDDTAEKTLAAIETIVNSEDNKKLPEDEQVTLDNAVLGENKGKVIYGSKTIDILGVKVESESGGVIHFPVKKTLGVDKDGVNVNKKVQVALVKIDSFKSETGLQAGMVKDSLVAANIDNTATYEETGKLGSAKTKDGKYLLVVIVTDKRAEGPVVA